MAVTMQDIADLAGVSRPVVSAVLNNNSKLRVAATTRARIIELINKTGYTKNLSACMLNGQTSRSIAIFTPPNEIPVIQELRYQASWLISAYGYRVMHFPLIMNKSSAELIGDALQFGIDGFITIDCAQKLSHSESKTPMVSLMNERFSSDIKVDLEAGEYELSKHLIEHGHRRICLIGSGLSNQPSKIAGFRRACEEHGIDLNHAPIFDLLWNPTFSEQLKQYLFHDRITAFACSNDFTAVRLLGYLHGLGIKVPDDVALGGYDGDMYACSGPCRITTVRQPVASMGRYAVDLLIDRIKNKKIEGPQATQFLKPQLHLGESCGCTPPLEKTICWERSFTTLEGANNLIQVPPPELIESYQNFPPSTKMEIKQKNTGVPPSP